MEAGGRAASVEKKKKCRDIYFAFNFLISVSFIFFFPLLCVIFFFLFWHCCAGLSFTTYEKPEMN